jgi:hypothetical protein
MKLYKIILVFIFFLIYQKSFTQTPDSVHKKIRNFAWIGGVAYTTAMTSLGISWYGNTGFKSFRFYDDNHEWKQMDKFGHFYTTFHLTQGIAEGLESVGMTSKKARLWAAASASFMMLNIEVFDGFSPQYGSSWGDLLANTSGAFFCWGQYQLWNEVRIHPKFSFCPSGFAPLRPNLLGKTLAEQFVKDYNAQTYFYSIDIDKFLPKNSRFPKWLNVCVGYGAKEMVSAEDYKSIELGYQPYRRFLVGLDWDLTSIKTNKKWVKKLLYVVNMFRLPAPTLEWNERGQTIWYWWYF